MNKTLINIAVLASSLLIGYLFGSIPSGVLIGRIFFHKDPRDYYSHNSGGTNSGRVFGKKIGVLVIILDMIKTALPIYALWATLTFSSLRGYMVWESDYDAAPLYYWLAGLSAAIGHCWPVYIHFKGGKAVSCYMGTNILTSWVEFCFAGFTYLFIAGKKKIISLASIITSLAGTLTAWIMFILSATIKTAQPFDLYYSWGFGFLPLFHFGWEFALVDTLIAPILIFRHKANIKRLRQGTEAKTTDKLEKI
jgi:acyl phosphate:glycerol-3-phosphate acyltransferase